MKKALVSVVIPAFNRVPTIGAALRSFQAQTHRDWEAIVVDDGSSDGTAEVVMRLAHEDDRIKLIKHDRNCGAQAARNTGIRSSCGEWIAFLDSDDQWLPQSLDIRLDAAQRNKLSVVHSDCYKVYEDGHRALYGVPSFEGWIHRELLRRQGPMFQGLLVVREALDRIGGLDERLGAFEGLDTVIRLARHYRFGFVATPTFIYDCRSTDTISKNELRDTKGYEQVVRKHFLSILRYAGPRAVSQHYEFIADRYYRTGNKSAALRTWLVSSVWSPPHPRRIARQFRELLRLW